MSLKTMESFQFLNKRPKGEILDGLIAKEVFKPLDLAFSSWILKERNSSSENEFCFVCYLMASARQGHLCLKISEDQIFPCISINELEKKSIIDGYKGLNDESFSGRIIWKEGRVYLHRNWYFESRLVKTFQKMVSEEPVTSFSEQDFYIFLNEKVECKALLQSQVQAIRPILKNRLCFITGGPGTGKTYCAAQMIEILMHSKSFERPLHVIVCAPTGKAASNLLVKISENPDLVIESKTIHSLLRLKWQKGLENKPKDILADLVVVDEASMIDVRLFSLLLDALNSNSRVVFLGDPNQLPPVEIGTVFSDLQDLAKNYDISHELKVFQRFDSNEIILFAQEINAGNINRAFSSTNENLSFPEWGEVENEVNRALMGVQTPSDKPFDPVYVCDFYQKFRILTPFRMGEFGTCSINQNFLEKIVVNAKEGQWICFPIVIQKNNPKLELYNGMTGVIVYRMTEHTTHPIHFKEFDQAFFKEPSGVRSFGCYELPEWDLGFALSVHKSQGSEYDSVLLLLPKNSEYFGKELIYTAITRAKKSVTIVSNIDTLQSISKISSKKINGILDYSS